MKSETNINETLVEKYPVATQIPAVSPYAPSAPAAAYSYSNYGTHISAYLHESEKSTNLCSYTFMLPFRMHTYKCVVYHFLNSILAISALLFMLLGTVVGIVLIPLCCMGACILSLLLKSIKWFATVDVYLFNFLADTNQKIIIHESSDFSNNNKFGYRLSTALKSPLSSETFVAAVYFVFFKFPVAIFLSMFSLSLWILSIAMIFEPLFPLIAEKSCVVSYDGECESDRNSTTLSILSSISFGIFFFYIAATISNIFAKSSGKVTRFCCCEYYTRYVNVSIPPSTSFNTQANYYG